MDPLIVNAAFGLVTVFSSGALFKVYKKHEAALQEFKKIKNRLDEVDRILGEARKNAHALKKKHLTHANHSDLEEKILKAEKELKALKASVA